MARLGVPYFYESSPLIEIAGDCMAKGDNRVSICSFCSRMKRGILYSTARREGYGALAMAQHPNPNPNRHPNPSPNPNP